MNPLPTGTVTFLFTDIEGSTSLWEQSPDAMHAALARHNTLLQIAIEHNAGAIFKKTGDGCLAAFPTAPEALLAALAIQQALSAETWEVSTPLKVRIAIHTGTAELHEGDYLGVTLNRTARLLATGYGGQTLLSLATFELVRDVLPPDMTLTDLGAHRLKDLQRPEIVFQLEHPTLAKTFPPLRSLDNPLLLNNLPQQTTSFIGREETMREIKHYLTKTRLLTLLGSGGCGKTRLSLQVAAEVLDGESDGVWFVEFAPLTDPALVPQTLANVLGVKEEAGKPALQSLVEYLQPKRTLLIFDNCEHLIHAIAELADALLRQCPKVTLLATSREALNVTGETQYRIPSLSLPDAKQKQTAQSLSQFEAVQLFIERALLAKTTFAVTNENAPALAQLCVHLDGIPLAIELAAARIRSLSVEEINDRLDNRFRLLTGGARTALPRQQTLRALIDWSYDLLGAKERALLGRLSVFVDGWSLEAAEAISVNEGEANGIEAWEVFDLLTGLVDKSLVNADTHIATRYRLLETVRHYAAEKLDANSETDEVKNRFVAYFLGFAGQAANHLEGPEQTTWLNALEIEYDNLRTALAWATESPERVEMGLKMAKLLWQFWYARGYLNEGRLLLMRVLEQTDSTISVQARADALNCAGLLVSHLGDYTEAKHFYEQSLALRRLEGDERNIAQSLNNLGLLALQQSDYAAAKSLFGEALEINRKVDNPLRQTINLLNLAEIAVAQYDYALAKTISEEGLQLSRQIGSRHLEAGCYLIMGRASMEQKEYNAAKTLCNDALTIFYSLGFKPWIANVLSLIAQRAAHQAHYERAVCLWGAEARLREVIRVPLTPDEQATYQEMRALAQNELSGETFEAAWATGSQFTLEQTIEFALA